MKEFDAAQIGSGDILSESEDALPVAASSSSSSSSQNSAVQTRSKGTQCTALGKPHYRSQGVVIVHKKEYVKIVAKLLIFLLLQNIINLLYYLVCNKSIGFTEKVLSCSNHNHSSGNGGLLCPGRGWSD